MRAIMLAVLVFLPSQDVQEKEPNDRPETTSQAIRPGDAFAGALSKDDKHDWVWIECTEVTVVDFTLTATSAKPIQLFLHIDDVRDVRVYADAHRVPVRLLRVRLPKGRHRVLIESHEGAYRLETKVVTDLDGRETEPNDRAEDALLWSEGRTLWAQSSGVANDRDFIRFDLSEPGIRHLVVKRLRPDAKKQFTAVISVRPLRGESRYVYRINRADDEFHFYPVLAAGPHILSIDIGSETPVEDAYELTMSPYAPSVSPEDVKTVEAAVERAVTWLLKTPEKRSRGQETIAAEGMVCAALSEGRGAKERAAAVDRDIVEWLEKMMQKADKGTWAGREVAGFVDGMYGHAMATLGLAEAAGNGSERARKACERAVEYLLATQQTERKCAAWGGPVAAGDLLHHGGWRYQEYTVQHDNSVAGWCAIALTAADVAGVKVDGLRDGLVAAARIIARTSDEKGFGYENPGGANNIRNSIGALICLLYGLDPKAMRVALADMDAHLPAATQVDVGDEYVFYYLYYATRASYLRGGPAWEAWRAVAIRQLLRRQLADGSWAPIDAEQRAGPRWATALAVMVLRLCLNEPPKYMRLEVKGF